MRDLLRLLGAETIKLKHSGVLWLATAGTLLTNLMLAVIPFNAPVVAEFLEMDPLAGWEGWIRFHYLGILPMLLPMFLVILCALSVHTETRASAWKLLYALPVPKAVIYLSKLLVIAGVFALAHLLFMVLMVLIPLAIGHGFPSPFPAGLLWKLAAGTIVGCLGILSLVYLASYFSRSFVLPLAVGILGFVLAQLIADYNLDGTYFPFSWPAQAIEGLFQNSPVATPLALSLLCAVLLALGGMWLARRDRTKRL